MRRRRKTPRRKAQEKAEAAWKFRVKDNASWRCEKCGVSPPVLHAHHFVSRSYARLKFDLRNGVSLCPKDHLFGRDSAHKGGPLFTEWFRSVRPDDYRYMIDPKTKRLREEHSAVLSQNRTEADYLEIAESLGPESEGMETEAA